MIYASSIFRSDIKGMLVIWTFDVGKLGWFSEPIQCAMCEYKYDSIKFHLNDNNTQKH